MEGGITDYEDQRKFCPQHLQIGYFSLGGNRECYPDQRQMKYYVEPELDKPLNLDLNKGYSTVKKYDRSSRKMIFDHVLFWIQLNSDKLITNDGSRLQADFVCLRGLLTAVLCTKCAPSEDGFLICASKFRETIYMYAFDTEEYEAYQAASASTNSRDSYRGKKFEQYLTSSTRNGVPDVESPVNENEEFRVIVKSIINHHTVFCVAEVDAVDPAFDDSDESCAKYVEFKTSKYVEPKTLKVKSPNFESRSFLRYKLPKWWAQSSAVGIEKVICGFRNESGIVKRIKSYKTSEMPALAEGLWSPDRSWNFCDEFLNYVKKYVKKDDPQFVYKFTWKPNTELTYEKLGYSEKKYSVLPEWYVSALNEKLK